EDRAQRIESLARKVDDGAATPGECAALSVLYLDAGRFAEAFSCYGVELGPALEEALRAPPALAIRELIVEGHGDMGDAYLTEASLRSASGLQAGWRERLRAELWCA